MRGQGIAPHLTRRTAPKPVLRDHSKGGTMFDSLKTRVFLYGTLITLALFVCAVIA